MVQKSIRDNETIIRDYEKHKSKVAPVKESTVNLLINRIRMLDKFLGKSYYEATQNDIADFLEHYKDTTRNNTIKILKAFYRWLYDLEKGDRLPDCIRRFTSKEIKQDDIQYRERVVSLDEYQRLLDHASKPMHKAILETMWIFGVRVSELLSLNSDDVIYEGGLTEITIRKSKTEPRSIPYTGRAKNLMTYVESYQLFKGQKNMPLFVGRDKTRYKIHSMEKLLERLTIKAGIRHITTHDFRHTSITRDLGNGVPITHVETKHGLAKGSSVFRIYDHNKIKDYKEWLNQRKKETPPTYKTLEKENESLIKKQEKEIDRLKQELVQVSRKVDSILVDYGEVIVDKVTGKTEIIRKGPRRIINGEIGKAEVIDMRDKKSK